MTPDEAGCIIEINSNNQMVLDAGSSQTMLVYRSVYFQHTLGCIGEMSPLDKFTMRPDPPSKRIHSIRLSELSPKSH